MTRPPPRRLCTREFLALNAIYFLAFCNLAVFFNFYDYLGTLPLDPRWFGFLIGLFSLAALVVRPILIPFSNTGNAFRWMFLGAGGVMLSLTLYTVADDLPSLLALRVFHGLSYVLLATALITLMVTVIPPEKSGQGFGIISASTLLPYAFMPPVLEQVISSYGYDAAYWGAAAVMLLIFPLLRLVGGSLRAADGGEAGGTREKLGRREFIENFKRPQVLIILAVTLLTYLSFTVIFFFLKTFAAGIGVARVGLFFSIATTVMILVRLTASALFDRLNKALLCAASMALLSVLYLLLGRVTQARELYLMGGFFGLGWGAVMPLLNAALFDISAPRLQGLNTNMLVQMINGAFFLGPIMGAAVISAIGFPFLFVLLSILSALSAGLALFLRKGRAPAPLAPTQSP